MKSKKNISSIFSDIAVAFFQIIIYILFSRLLRYFFRANKKVSASMRQLKRGSLIVANHQSILDPFIILAHLPFRIFLRTIPIRFPTTHRFYIRLKFLAILGMYDIGDGNRERMLGLMRTRQYLIDKKSIMLFPEGKLCASNNKGVNKFQEGIVFFTETAENVIFVKMEGFHRSDWLKLKGARRNMIFSDVHQLKGTAKNIELLQQCLEELSI